MLFPYPHHLTHSLSSSQYATAVHAYGYYRNLIVKFTPLLICNNFIFKMHPDLSNSVTDNTMYSQKISLPWVQHHRGIISATAFTLQSAHIESLQAIPTEAHKINCFKIITLDMCDLCIYPTPCISESIVLCHGQISMPSIVDSNRNHVLPHLMEECSNCIMLLINAWIYTNLNVHYM